MLVNIMAISPEMERKKINNLLIELESAKKESQICEIIETIRKQLASPKSNGLKGMKLDPKVFHSIIVKAKEVKKSDYYIDILLTFQEFFLMHNVIEENDLTILYNYFNEESPRKEKAITFFIKEKKLIYSMPRVILDKMLTVLFFNIYIFRGLNKKENTNVISMLKEIITCRPKDISHYFIQAMLELISWNSIKNSKILLCSPGDLNEILKFFEYSLTSSVGLLQNKPVTMNIFIAICLFDAKIREIGEESKYNLNLLYGEIFKKKNYLFYLISILSLKFIENYKQEYKFKNYKNYQFFRLENDIKPAIHYENFVSSFIVNEIPTILKEEIHFIFLGSISILNWLIFEKKNENYEEKGFQTNGLSISLSDILIHLERNIMNIDTLFTGKELANRFSNTILIFLLNIINKYNQTLNIDWTSLLTIIHILISKLPKSPQEDKEYQQILIDIAFNLYILILEDKFFGSYLDFRLIIKIIERINNLNPNPFYIMLFFYYVIIKGDENIFHQYLGQNIKEMLITYKTINDNIIVKYIFELFLNVIKETNITKIELLEKFIINEYKDITIRMLTEKSSLHKSYSTFLVKFLSEVNKKEVYTKLIKLIIEPIEVHKDVEKCYKSFKINTIFKMFYDFNNIFQYPKMKCLCDYLFTEDNFELYINFLTNFYMTSTNEIHITNKDYKYSNYLSFPCLYGERDSKFSLSSLNSNFYSFNNNKIYKLIITKLTNDWKHISAETFLNIISKGLERIFIFNKENLESVITIFQPEAISKFRDKENVKKTKLCFDIIKNLNYQMNYKKEFYIGVNQRNNINFPSLSTQSKTSILDFLLKLYEILAEGMYKKENKKLDIIKGSVYFETNFNLGTCIPSIIEQIISKSEKYEKKESFYFSLISTTLGLIAFYFCSCCDEPIEDYFDQVDLSKGPHQQISQKLEYFHNIIDKYKALLDIHYYYPLVVLNTIFQIKEVIILFNDTLIVNFLLLAFSIGWKYKKDKSATQAQLIKCFKNYQDILEFYKSNQTTLNNQKTKPSNIYSTFVEYLSDNMVFYLAQFISKDRKVTTLTQIEAALPKSENDNQRLFILSPITQYDFKTFRREFFLEMINLILKLNGKKRDNINYEYLDVLNNAISDFKNFDVYFIDKYTFFLIMPKTERTAIMMSFNLVSSFEYEIATNFRPFKEYTDEEQLDILTERLNNDYMKKRKFKKCNSFKLQSKYSLEKQSVKRCDSLYLKKPKNINIENTYNTKSNAKFFHQIIQNSPSSKNSSNILFFHISNITKPRDLIHIPFNEKLLRYLQTLGQSPVEITYYINVFYSPNVTKELNHYDILVYNGEVSDMFLNFISLLGKFTKNPKTKKYTLSYSDNIYNVIFEILSVMKNEQSRYSAIFDVLRPINIIWVDNPIQNIENSDPFFMDERKSFLWIFVIPLSDSYCLIKRRFSAEGKAKINPRIEKFEDFFLNDFVINIKSFSGIRYLLDIIIQYSDLFRFAMQEVEETKRKDNYVQTPNNTPGRMSNESTTPEKPFFKSCFYERKTFLESIKTTN